MARKPNRTSRTKLPSRQEVLAFIADHPGQTGKRELARAFGVTGTDRVPLKRLLKELADEGLIEKRRKKMQRPGTMPPVGVLSIVDRTNDGDLAAEPVDWDETAGPPPRIVILSRRGSRGAAPGLGDRVLARITPENDGYTARIIRLLERRPESVLGVVRRVGSELRLAPIDRKQREAVIKGGLGKAKEGDLVSAKLKRGQRRYISEAEIIEVIGSMKDEKAVSMIAILAHGLPLRFRMPCSPKSRRRGRSASTSTGKTGATCR